VGFWCEGRRRGHGEEEEGEEEMVHVKEGLQMGTFL
jgi:hypothetical protein